MSDTLPSPSTTVPRPVWWGDWPLPKTVPLPGLRVRVRAVPQERIPGQSFFGAWVYDTITSGKPVAIVYINKDLPLPVQRYTLLHELQHVLVDLLDQMIEKFPEYVATASMMKLMMELMKRPANFQCPHCGHEEGATPEVVTSTP